MMAVRPLLLCVTLLVASGPWAALAAPAFGGPASGPQQQDPQQQQQMQDVQQLAGFAGMTQGASVMPQRGPPGFAMGGGGTTAQQAGFVATTSSGQAVGSVGAGGFQFPPQAIASQGPTGVCVCGARVRIRVYFA